MMRVAFDSVVGSLSDGLNPESRGRRRSSRWSWIAGSAVLLFFADPAQGFQPGEATRAGARIYTERADAIELGRAEQAFATGDLAGGIAHLRRLLDRPSDSFVSGPNGPTGVRLAAAQLLNRQPPAARRFFELAEAGAGLSGFESQEDAADFSDLRRVTARYPGTEAGFRAADRLARIAFDRGEFEAAARLWEGLLADPGHAGRITPAMVARLTVAVRQSGRDGRVSALSVRYAGTPVRLGGEAATLGALLSRLDPVPPRLPQVPEPDTVAPNLTPPAFPPMWQDREVGRELTRELWAASRGAEARPLATPAGAVLTDDGTVIARRPSGLVAMDAETGGQLWGMALATNCGAGSEHGDLHDLTRFEAGYASGGVFGRLSADAVRVFVVDRAIEPAGVEIKTASHVSAPIYNQQVDGDHANRLLAIPLGAAGPDQQPLWTAGGARESGSPLADHYFFGPPCVTPDGLIALTEHRQRLNLVMLEPESGEVLAQQPLGYVARPVSIDPERGAVACPPAVSGGIAVCGTNAGFVVAFDYVAGRLLWAYDYAATEPDATGGDGPADRVCYQGDPAFPCPVLIRQDRVVLMPHDSRLVHCVDLRNGSPLWTAPRGDGLYVGCLTDTAALVVGRSQCRSLSIVHGGTVWSARFGTPSGTGVATDRAYLLPLEEGRIAAIDLARGKPIGFDLPREGFGFQPMAGPATSGGPSTDRWLPGNLYTDGRTLLSVGPVGTARFCTAGQVAQAAGTALPALELARVELAAGRIEEARRRLELLTAGRGEDGERESARLLLRELHFLRIAHGSGPALEEALAELDRLSVTATERARFLLHAAEHDLDSANHPTLVGRAEELVTLSMSDPISSPHDPALLVTPASWIPALIRRSAGSPEIEGTDPSRLSTPELTRRLTLNPDGSESADLRGELSRRAADDGELQKAELLRLQIRERAASAEALAVAESGEARVSPPGIRAAEAIAGVSVKGKLWAPADEGVRLAFGGMRRGFLTRGRDPFRVVDRGDSRQSRLTVVDLAKGVCLGEVPVDARLRFPLLSRQPVEGHFVPVASVGKLHGLSLLEMHRGEPVWTTDLPADGGLLPQVGPYGASFCTVQTRRELTTIDPTTGNILWKRIDLPPEKGLHGDQAAGLFGDAQALTMLDADGTSYTVYRTGTGEELGGGRLPIDRQRQRRAYGRKLFFVETGQARSTARLWDPLRNAYELEIDFEGRLLQTSTRDDELVLLFGDGRLLVFDTKKGAAAVDVRLAPADVAQAHTLWVFADAERYYVSLYHADPRRFEEAKVASFIYDTPLSAAHVQGRLLAIDRRTGKTLWSRSTEQRTVVDPIDHPTPFLVAVARVSDRRFGSRKTLLVEAIDKKTGETLGASDALVPDQPLQIRTSPGRVSLAGMTSTVELEYGARPAPDAIVLGAR